METIFDKPLDADVAANSQAIANLFTVEEKSVTLGSTKYGEYYYADVTPTQSVLKIVSVIVIETTYGRIGWATVKDGIIRVWGDYSSSSMTIRILYKN